MLPLVWRLASAKKFRTSVPCLYSFPVLLFPPPPHEQSFESSIPLPAVHNPSCYGLLPRRWSTMAEGITLCEQNSRDQQSDTDIPDQTIRRFKHPAWPEWTLFLNRLKSVALIDNEILKPGIADARELFSDVALLKQSFVKFAQVHESILERLPRNELDALTKYEFPKNDERTAAARKRVQKYLQMKESNVSSSGGDLLFPAKLKDVMRLLYRAISATSCVGHTDIGRKEVLVQLLQNLIALTSATPSTMLSDQEHSHHKKVEPMGDDKESGRLYKTGSVSLNSSEGSVEEWKCSRCSFVNVYGKESCGSCNGTRETNVSDQQEDSDPRKLNQSNLHQSCGAENVQEPRKFQSIKERVDARRARLERERIQKEARAASLSDQKHRNINEAVTGLHVSSSTTLKNVNKASVEVHDSPQPKNFHDLDAIVASFDSDEEDSMIPQRTVSASAKGDHRISARSPSRRFPSKMDSSKGRW